MVALALFMVYFRLLRITIGACKNVLVLAGDTTSHDESNDKSLRMVFGDCGTASL